MKKLFLGISLMAMLACSGKEKKPEGLMSQQEMINFLIDLHIVEARLNIMRVPNDTISLFFDEVEDSLFQKHGINDSIYYQSYQYYLDHIGEMETIYEAVVDSLSIRERVIDD